MSQVAIIYRESKERYLNGDSFTWCPCCGEPYCPSDDEIEEALSPDGSVYCECCECGESFYLGTGINSNKE